MEGLRNKILLRPWAFQIMPGMHDAKSWHFVAENDIAIGCVVVPLDTAQTKPN
jgi:hypothetical protein